MSLPPSIRVNVRAPFPTQVKASAFLSIAKKNGIWTVTPDYRLLAETLSVTPTQIIGLQDAISGAWSYVPIIYAASAALTSYRLITTAGAVTVQATDVVLLLQKSPSGPSTINLPSSAARYGAPVIIKDLTGDANVNNITVVPVPGETIDGFSAAAAAANGVAVISTNYDVMRLYPLTSGGYYKV